LCCDLRASSAFTKPWSTSNWQYWPAALEKVDEALTTLGGGQGVVVFYAWPNP